METLAVRCDLDKDIFMEQPYGFASKEFPTMYGSSKRLSTASSELHVLGMIRFIKILFLRFQIFKIKFQFIYQQFVLCFFEMLCLFVLTWRVWEKLVVFLALKWRKQMDFFSLSKDMHQVWLIVLIWSQHLSLNLLGSLFYLTIRRSAISFSIGVISQLMGEPREPHLIAANRILRYIISEKQHLYWTGQVT